MCKHAAAVLYGVGSRLDKSPELLFRLRGVDEAELIAADMALPRGTAAADHARGRPRWAPKPASMTGRF